MYYARAATQPSFDDEGDEKYFDKFKSVQLTPRAAAHLLHDFVVRNVTLYRDGFYCDSPIPFSFRMFEKFMMDFHPDVPLRSVFNGAYYHLGGGNAISFLFALIFDYNDESESYDVDNIVIHSCHIKIYELIKLDVEVKDVYWIIRDDVYEERLLNMCPQLHGALQLIAKHGNNLIEVQRDLVRIKRRRLEKRKERQTQEQEERRAAWQRAVQDRANLELLLKQVCVF